MNKLTFAATAIATASATLQCQSTMAVPDLDKPADGDMVKRSKLIFEYLD